jgi:hypothetical protein
MERVDGRQTMIEPKLASVAHNSVGDGDPDHAAAPEGEEDLFGGLRRARLAVTTKDL